MIDLNKLEERIAHAKAEILFMGMEPEEMEELTTLIRRQEAEHLATHRKLAAETLRADQGWTRYEEANKDRNALRAERAALPATGAVTDAQIDALATEHCPGRLVTAGTLRRFARAILAAQPAPSAAPIPAQPVAWMVQDAADIEMPGTGTCRFSRDNPADYGYGVPGITALYAASQAAAPDAMADIKAISDAILEAGDHLRTVMAEHPYCDHVQVVKSFADIIRRRAKSAAAQPEAKAAPADDAKLPTDLSQRLRAKACQPFGPEDFALLTKAADEIERYYGGMMAWKQTAEKKDADWNAERMGRVDDRIAARNAAPALATQPEIEVSVDYLHCRHVAPIKQVVRTDGRISILVESLPAPATLSESIADHAEFREDLIRLSDPGLSRQQAKVIRKDIYRTIDARVRNAVLAAAGNSQSPAAPAAVAAAPGWKLVPPKPTEDMVVAFLEAWFMKRRAIDDPEMDDAYAAMLAAAPAPKEPAP